MCACVSACARGLLAKDQGVGRVGRVDWPRRSRQSARSARKPERAGRGEWEVGESWSSSGMSVRSGIKPSPPSRVIAEAIECVLVVKYRETRTCGGAFVRRQISCVLLPPLRSCLRRSPSSAVACGANKPLLRRTMSVFATMLCRSVLCSLLILNYCISESVDEVDGLEH